MNTQLNDSFVGPMQLSNAQAHVAKANALRPKNSIALIAQNLKASQETAPKPEPTKVVNADRGHKISQAQLGLPKKPVTVKVGDKTYGTLCDALRAHGFNVQGDWIKARKLLKTGPADMGNGIVIEMA
jgi:hypothetical protein